MGFVCFYCTCCNLEPSLLHPFGFFLCLNVFTKLCFKLAWQETEADYLLPPFQLVQEEEDLDFEGLKSPAGSKPFHLDIDIHKTMQLCKSDYLQLPIAEAIFINL